MKIVDLRGVEGDPFTYLWKALDQYEHRISGALRLVVEGNGIVAVIEHDR